MKLRSSGSTSDGRLVSAKERLDEGKTHIPYQWTLHSHSVHKETIDAVPNAIPGRTDIELEIYGMEGIPEKDMDERRRLLEQKTQAESQKKKQQDDSDEYDDDDSAASTSFQPQPVQPQQGYIPPMAQPGLPPVPGAPGMPPGIPPLMPGVPPLMPGMPPVMPGMPPGMMPMGGMMPPGPGIPPLMPGMPPGMPPPVPRPGIPPMTQAQAVSAPGILNRPPAPTATVPAPQPPVTKPLFPSAGQEERRAQLPKYQRNLPRPGQAPIGNPPVGPIGGQYGGHHQGMPGYLPGAMPPYGQGPPMVPPYQAHQNFTGYWEPCPPIHIPLLVGSPHIPPFSSWTLLGISWK
ncbi:hypothetical protein CB1_000765047 [Camelus ferus]|nr:hypothetical protein CB1_000765047 [Camelus ferus]